MDTFEHRGTDRPCFCRRMLKRRTQLGEMWRTIVESATSLRFFFAEFTLPGYSAGRVFPAFLWVDAC